MLAYGGSLFFMCVGAAAILATVHRQYQRED